MTEEIGRQETVEKEDEELVAAPAVIRTRARSPCRTRKRMTKV